MANPTTARIRFGVIGAGAIGAIHMETLNKLADVAELKAVTDTYLPLAEQRATEYNIPVTHASPEALLADPELDAVVIAVPNQFHAPLTIAALEAGKHVILEKPMAIDSAKAKEIVDVQERTGKTLIIAQQMRFSGLARAVKAVIDEGKLGRIYNVKSGWIRKKGIPGWGSWFTRKELAGGGPLIDIGVHMIDLALHFMGGPRPVSVFGTTYAEFGPHKRGTGNWGTPNWEGTYDVEDLATALIKLDNGATLALDVSWAAHAADMSDEPFIHLMGSEGGISYVGNTAKFITHVDNEVVTTEIAPLDDSNERELLARHFIQSIQDGTTPISSAISGYTNNRILDAIYESSETGNQVKLNWN
ncbi:Gfo/Idh/MocA family protein [Paenibacillus sp. MMS18-CY102]|uniref:Gfo/Idh/MocA family protein n=1 Tax=Paenibacillus sp. MMS18-CY102 TaxID=2682849 RepID=UPI00136557F5|nr:Gfo/Idh/MocA family oxidoreductase [Paenibacillus sp. MMS18-CY102]MWC30334.1 gfo/Idh/MocA family oxidoreductase [Paenibacillus sp. MMS18-CY102]